MGGKKAPDEDTSPPDPSELYSAAELLPVWARPSWVADLVAEAGLSRVAAQDFLRNVGRVPAWALNIAPLNQFRQAAR